MASKYSWIVTRRAPDILAPGEVDEVGWSVVRHIIPKGRRDPYFAYLAAQPRRATRQPRWWLTVRRLS
jgi:hypothetical protein